jgi:hypothetical protein
LQARPHLGFNKEGSLLAVTTRNNGVKILANADGLQFLGMLENRGAPPASVITKVVWTPNYKLPVHMHQNNGYNIIV